MHLSLIYIIYMSSQVSKLLALGCDDMAGSFIFSLLNYHG